jgi:hypothetical protein
MSVAITAKVVMVGIAAYSAKDAHDSAGDANKTTKNWRQRGLDIQEEQYNQNREDLAPYRELGYGAIANLEDPDAYQSAPGYQWRLDEGTRNLENRFSTKSGGGNAMRELMEYGQNYASADYYDYRNDQRANAGLGQSSTHAGVMAGQNNATNRSNIWQTSGQDQASIGMWGSNNQMNAINSGISNFLYGAKDGYTPSRANNSGALTGYGAVDTNEINWDDFKG